MIYTTKATFKATSMKNPVVEMGMLNVHPTFTDNPKNTAATIQPQVITNLKAKYTN